VAGGGHCLGGLAARFSHFHMRNKQLRRGFDPRHYQAAEPTVTQKFAGEGESLRLDVTHQTADVALLMAAPISPSIARNNDRDGGHARGDPGKWSSNKNRATRWNIRTH
jgi:hypothetical protein